ncbi:uncharacterized protein LOC121680525 [Alosa sapidissima]|uniref:uncharacterized protein LOC121680525 n=1 Tax=Alosa sapidissima TaxID=34773 RepID=UPI001C089BE2|nr:uncharacterized protein LOC121680525 [Alosa sapidissima]
MACNHSLITQPGGAKAPPGVMGNISTLAFQPTPARSRQLAPLDGVISPLTERIQYWRMHVKSDWIIKIIAKGYRLQFATPPPPFNGIVQSHATGESARVLQGEIISLLNKQAIRVVPFEQSRHGFYSRYFLVPKKGGGGLRPILDLRALNRYLRKYRFRMLTNDALMCFVRPGDWFTSVDLTDAFLHVTLAHRLILWSSTRLLSLKATHVPGVLNLGADLLSRGNPRYGDWKLHSDVVAQIWLRTGRAKVDLFASEENAQCPMFFFLRDQKAPLGIDALAHQWPHVLLYAFPPLELITPTLARVREQSLSLILVAPRWPGKPWLAEIIPLLHSPPWPLPPRRDLLSQANGEIFHPHPERLALWVWPVKG